MGEQLSLDDLADQLEAEWYAAPKLSTPLRKPFRDAITVNNVPFVAHSETSRQAASATRLSAPNQRERVLGYIRGHQPCTDEQIAIGLGLNPSTARPRRIELQRSGKIQPFGKGTTASGHKAVQWVIADPPLSRTQQLGVNPLDDLP